VSCGSSRTRNGLLSRRGACLNLLLLVPYRPLVLQTTQAWGVKLPMTQVTRAVSTGGGIGVGIG